MVGMASLAQETMFQGSNYQENNPKRKKMSQFDQEYVKACIDKYGENYKAMERDIELNYFQHSETKMKTLCEKYKNLTENSMEM